MPNSAMLALLLVAGALTPGAVLGQGAMELAIAGPQPHFVAAWAPKKEREAERAAVLAGRVSLELTGVSLDEALKTLTNEAELIITYSPTVLPTGRRVTIKAGDIAVVTALTEMLFRSGLDVVVDRDGTLALVRCRHPRAENQDSGTIVGTVTDRVTGNPLAGATVVLEGTQFGATTNSRGQYHIARIEPGTYTARARYIGYAVLSSTIVVRDGEEVSADFALERSVQKLDELVTTGTVVPTAVKALPTPISVIDAEEIAQRRPQTLQDVIRQAIPTSLAPDDPAQPALSFFSVRGASSLSGTGTMKIFVDGVEAATFGNTAIDPVSIGRVEVIRGPQASTIYGADAAGGVIQIFTKRGDHTLARPQISAQAELGIAQTPYSGYGGVLRQNYTGSVRGGSQDVSYNFGGGYTRLGDYLPNGELSRQVSPSVYGGMRFSRGMVAADLSVRYYVNKLPFVLNPLLLTSGFVPFSRPNYQIQKLTNETYGAQITVSPTIWWRNQVTLGIDRTGNNAVQTRPRFTTPADTLYSVTDLTRRKVSVGYNTSISATLNASLAGSVTAGVDHYDQDASTFFTAQAINTQGTIRTDPAGSYTQGLSTITNTGYFAQIQASVRDVLFLTGGLRAESNSTFGADLGTPVLPRLGLSVVQQIGQTTLKLRGSYGRAIRAPGPGQTFGSVTPTLVTLANPLLGPEQQQGWDAGIDLIFGALGSLSLTGYDQVAKDLIVFVPLGNTSPPTSQFQNVGRVANRGVEVEATLNFQPLQLKAQYGYVHSRIEDLGPVATPGLHVGDRPLALPKHTAGAALTLFPRAGTSLTAGLTYVGSYRQTDFVALYRCFGGTGPCPADFDFVADFPGFAKVNAAITQRITQQLDGFVSVENLTNNKAYELYNFDPVVGRITMAGLHVRY